jgi:hypothetical protein
MQDVGAGEVNTRSVTSEGGLPKCADWLRMFRTGGAHQWPPVIFLIPLRRHVSVYVHHQKHALLTLCMGAFYSRRPVGVVHHGRLIRYGPPAMGTPDRHVCTAGRGLLSFDFRPLTVWLQPYRILLARGQSAFLIRSVAKFEVGFLQFDSSSRDRGLLSGNIVNQLVGGQHV